MSNKYENDIFDGKEVPPLVINEDSEIDSHEGTIHVESGTLKLNGAHMGTLSVHTGSMAIINGKQMGTVNLDPGSKVELNGNLFGSTNISERAELIINNNGELLGSYTIYGKIIVFGILSGIKSGDGEILVQEGGKVLSNSEDKRINIITID